jgi:hypothetical protein
MAGLMRLICVSRTSLETRQCDELSQLSIKVTNLRTFKRSYEVTKVTTTLAPAVHSHLVLGVPRRIGNQHDHQRKDTVPNPCSGHAERN